MSMIKGAEGGIDNPNICYKMKPDSQEESNKTGDKELISYDYIKKLESDNETLSRKLNEKCKLIKDLNNDLKRMESERLLCMIFESYQRFRTQISEHLETNGELKNGMKIDAFLDAVKKGKLFSGEKAVHWMINLDNTEGMQLLKDFRNDFSHYTINDLSILRQWRTRIIEESENESIKRSSDLLMNEAALNILNMVINHLSRPESRPLQRKSKKSGIKAKPTTMMAAKVIKKSGSELSMTTSKKQRKKLLKMMKRAESPSNAFKIGEVKPKEVESSLVPDIKFNDNSNDIIKETPLPISTDLSSSIEFSNTSRSLSDITDVSDVSNNQPLPIHHKALYDAYHRNAQMIGNLRKNGEMTPQKFAEIRRLRQENQKMVKEKGIGIMYKKKGVKTLEVNQPSKKKNKKKKAAEKPQEQKVIEIQ